MYVHDHFTTAFPVLTIMKGASPKELIFEACRRNNTSLLEDTLADLTAAGSEPGKKPAEHVAGILNSARDGVGNGILHVAATYGSCKSLRHAGGTAHEAHYSVIAEDYTFTGSKA
jgi:hypothetical protein